MTSYDVVIVGTGHGGARAATVLRNNGFQGSIAMIGAEPELPYERPPLSKEYLAGEKPFARLLIRPASFWEERAIAVLTDTRIVTVDPEAHRIATEAGAEIGYGQLIWAAGGSPRSLTCGGHDLAGVHSVRSHADVVRMTAELAATTRIVVIGGGYIGLEVAAVLVKAGKTVTIVEALDRVLARVAGEPLSRFFEAEHRARGIDIRLGAQVECIEEDAGRATGVRLVDGEFLPAEMVVVGIGIDPEIGPLRAAGAETGNGVAIDENGRTSLPDVFALGDCALHANRYADGLPIRLESVQNANDLATTVARAITGDPQPYDSVPWFWSNQYDLRLQTVGLSAGHDAVVVRGDIASRSFSIVYLKQGRILALDCVNATKDYVQGKALIETHAVVAPDLLADTTIPLKDILTHAVL